MNSVRQILLVAGAAAVLATPAAARMCDYRPSVLLGPAAASAVAGATAAGGEALRVAGHYTLVNPASGLTMMGTAVSGTLGVLSGTGGVLGTVGAVLLTPATIVAAGAAALGAGGMEAACFFTDERITDYDAVLGLMAHFAAHHPEDRFRLIPGIPGRKDDAIRIWNPQTEALDLYMVADLYLVNSTLMHRRRGINRNLGQMAYVAQVAAD